MSAAQGHGHAQAGPSTSTSTSTSAASSTPIPSYILASLPSAAVPLTSLSEGVNGIRSGSFTSSSRSGTNGVFPPTFPPSSSSATSTSSTSNLKSKTLGSLSTNVSDLLLSSLLPPNLPKLPPSSTTSTGTIASVDAGAGDGNGSEGLAGAGRGRGVPRELSTQREALSLPLVSNNFRRFVTRVGPVFYLQDRIEEVLFWRKPSWTWAWIITWTFICFQPRTLLLLPSLTLLLILLHIHERTVPLPSLLGITLPTSSATDRILPAGGSGRRTSVSQGSQARDISPANKFGGDIAAVAGNAGFTATTTRDADGETVGVPAVPPKEVESGVDYYMNLQAIQNLMGLISDAYDQITPRLAPFQSTLTPPPTSLPVTSTHWILLLLPPTLLLPLTPTHFIPYLLLPLGLVPPILFHPNIPARTLFNLPHHPSVRKIRSYVESILLNDSLSDEIGREVIDRVEVWENERLEPKLATSLTSSTNANNNLNLLANLPPTAWSAKYLRPSDRPAWVKVVSTSSSASSEGCKWKSTDDTVPLPTSHTTDKDKDKEAEASKVLALREGWAWIPGEDWRVDVCGLWSEMGVDDDGWVYSDDSWQNPASTPITEADQPLGGTMPGLALRRVTRRRRWWRRVYEVAEKGV